MPEDSIDLVVQNHSSDRSFTQGKASDAGLSSKNRKSIRWFFVVAVIFHIIYLTTVFDTYFVTTMSSEIPPVPQKVAAPADRVVIFMADGSKADAVFGFHPDGRPRAPFIREMIQTKGAFGVSHTRVPTETRIGNVAVMGGFSQDPSRITKGWTQNPVDYDHFFNRTTWGWVFASPGVSRLFVSTGNKEQTVDVTRYEPDMVDYSSGPSKLDDWVIGMFDQMLEYVAPTTSSSSNDSSTSTNTSDAAPRVGPTYEPHFSREELNEKLHSPKIGILLHLLGGDIAGHGHKPYSQVYFDTITHYDQLINDTVAKIDAFYGDSRTAYIFTADHGMLDSGSHGDGGLNNTRVPIVAWGAGISGPIKEKIIGASHDEYSRPWKLEEYVRRDIEQIDLSSLMASLVGVPIPINSEGVIPLDYLNVDDKSKSQFLLTNAEQICSAYEVREDMKKKNEPFFVPFKVSREDVDKAYTQIDEAITAGSYQESQDQAHELIVNCQSGITYLQRYDWILLFSMTILGYVGYILFGLTTALSNFTNVQDNQIPTQSRITLAKAVYYIFAGLLLTLLFLKHSPVRYYGYALFPLYFWFDFLFRTRHLFKREHLTLQNIGQCLIVIVCLEMIVWALHDRRSLSVISIMIGLWPIVAQQKRSLKLTISWVVACLVMAIFPFLPPIGGKDQFLYTLGWMGVMGVIIFGTIYLKEKLSWASILSKAYVLLSFYIANSSDRLLGKAEIPDYYQAFAWSTLVIAALPLFCGLNSKAHFSLRLFTIFSFASPLMIMLSTSYELLFFVCFGVQLTLWIYMERVPQANTQHTLNFSHFKNGIFVLFFVSSAFFGTGNLATISFSLESVFRFMTVFSPFVMGGLLMTRILLPFVLLAVVVIVVCKFSLRLASLSMLIIPMFAIGDVSTMTLFFLVKNSGSWADMGSSLARFIIASAFVMTMLILVGIGNLLMRKSKIEDGAFINLQDVPYAKGLPEDLASEDPSPKV